MSRPRRSRVRTPPHRRSRLSGGLGLLAVGGAPLPAVAASLLVRGGGGAADPQGRGGLAALTAALLDKGSRRRGAEALAVAVDDLGATCSAAAGWDSASVTLLGLAGDLPRLLELLAEIALEPAFPPDEFAILRDRRLHALARSLDHAATMADWTFVHHLFAGGPYGRPLAGTAASVAALGVSEVEAFHQARFAPAESVLAVAGQLDGEEAARQAERVLGGWSAPSAAPVPVADALAHAGRRVVLVDRPDLSQAQIRWGHPGLRRADPRFDAAELINDPLGGGGFSSRLLQEIRSRQGLTYGVHSSFDGRLHGGAFLISTYTPTGSVAQVLGEIDGIVEAYRDHGPTAAELDAAKDRFLGGYPLRFETPAQVAGQLLELDLYGLPADGLETYQDRLEGVSLSAATALAGELLRPEDALVVVVGDAAALEKELDRFGPLQRFDARRAFGVRG